MDMTFEHAGRNSNAFAFYINDNIETHYLCTLDPDRRASRSEVACVDLLALLIEENVAGSWPF